MPLGAESVGLADVLMGIGGLVVLLAMLGLGAMISADE